MQENKKVITISEIIEKNVCLGISDIYLLREIINKIDVAYIDKCLLLSAFMNYCDADEVRNYNYSLTKNSKDVRLARYFWIYLLHDNGLMTIKQISQSINANRDNISKHIKRFEYLLKHSELIKTKYDTCLELLQTKTQ